MLTRRKQLSAQASTSVFGVNTNGGHPAQIFAPSSVPNYEPHQLTLKLGF